MVHIPDSDRLIQGGRDNQVLGWVELRAHDIVGVAREQSYFLSALPIPDADGLIVTTGDDPGQFAMELDVTHVVEMACKSENTLLGLCGPHAHSVVVAPGHKERLRRMEIHRTHGPVVIVELRQQRAHAVVPELHRGRV